MDTRFMDAISPKHIGAIVLLLIIGTLTGFYLGRYSLQGQLSLTGTQQSQEASPFFQTQSASVQAEVSNVDGKNVTLKNQKGETKTFPVSAKLAIFKFSGKSPFASSSADLASVEKGKQAVVVLELVGNQYQIVSISYNPTPPTPK